MISDPISDFFTRIRNAIRVKHTTVIIPHSKFKEKITQILATEGYIKSYEVIEERSFKHIKIRIKYVSNKSVIQVIKNVSKPGSRYYISKENIPKYLNGFGICIISTSKGLMTGKQARIQNVGGEFIGVVN